MKDEKAVHLSALKEKLTVAKELAYAKRVEEHKPVMLILGLGLKANIFGLGLATESPCPWPWP